MAAMECRHTHTVRLRWLGYAGPTVITACDDCARRVWAALPQPLRETFSCEAAHD